ncbi:hypothetical protein HSX11_07805 [Oxalobacteraceae bacterium]|nr:hypothetical protein [Oxalobacteraceae bacterium]
MNTTPDPGNQASCDCQEALQALRLQTAREQAAQHRALIALERWRSGGCEAELRALDTPEGARQTAWHAHAQQQFCDWLEAGGFAQAESAEPSAAASRAQQAREALNHTFHELSYIHE